MLAFLLDTHVPAAVVRGVRAVRPDCQIEHLARWRGGALRKAADEDILGAAHAAGFVLVTYDLSTIPAIFHRLLEEGLPAPGLALVPTNAIAQTDVGGLVREIVRLYDQAALLDPAYPVVYLRPSTL